VSISHRFDEHTERRKPMLLSFVPRGDLFYILHDTHIGYSDNKQIPLICPYMKIAFQTDYQTANCINLITGEIGRIRENDTVVIRATISGTLVFEEM
jgi:hypothetical protein